jgi:signal transduction histidine kinase
MKNSRVKWLLFFSILIMTTLPLLASLYFLDHTLETSLNLGFNHQVGQALEIGSQNLKRLKLTDPENEPTYRAQFDGFENLKLVYSQPRLVKGSILDSLKIYFGLGLLAAVFLAVVIATLLSRRIALTYNANFQELLRHKEKVRYLEEISSWQELAKMLAHEIKNPLTPIQVLITSLTKSYLNKSENDFKEQLIQTETMVSEELGHLKNIVNRFSEFSKIPKVQLAEEDLPAVLEANIKTMDGTYDNAGFELNCPDWLSGTKAKVDTTLFRQVISNIIRNGVEANPKRKVQFKIDLSATSTFFCIAITNDGAPVPLDIRERIFDPYISNKSGKENMGLGLAIVKKIVIEHGGEISYLEEHGLPTFAILLRRAD